MDKAVEQEKINKILEAVQSAPSAVNYQPHKIFVIKSKEILNKLPECTRFLFNAPLNFLVCYDNTVSWKRKKDNKDSGDIDAAIIGTYIMLAAKEQGLDTTWVGSFDPIKVSEILHLPSNIVPVAFFPTGYAAENAEPAKMHYERKPIEETVVFV